MKKNMGILDRTIRIVLALVVVGLFFTELISGTMALILGLFAGVFLLTSFVSFCPLYVLLGINTCPSSKK